MSRFIPGSYTGRTAVENAKKNNVMKDSIALEQDKGSSASGVKTVDDKTFYLKNGFWTDSAFEESKAGKMQELTFGSNEYFELLKKTPGISKYLSVGRQVIVVFQGHSYRISFKQDA